MIGPPEVGDLGTILGVWAHPDDEAFLSGGVMAAARINGQRVVVVTATRGELGTPDPHTWPPHRPAHVPIDIASVQVAGAIDAVEPDTILTFGPDGYTGHRDHRTTSAWVDAAVS